MSKFEKSVKVFIGSYSAPAGGKWYDLSDEDDKEAAEARFSDNGSEPLISAIECEIDLLDEKHLSYYIEMQELLEDLDDDDFIKAGLIMVNESYNYDDANELQNALDDYSVFSGDNKSMQRLERQFVYDQIESGVLGDDVLNLFNSENSNYLDFDEIWRSLEMGDASIVSFNWVSYILYK